MKKYLAIFVGIVMMFTLTACTKNIELPEWMTDGYSEDYLEEYWEDEGFDDVEADDDECVIHATSKEVKEYREDIKDDVDDMKEEIVEEEYYDITDIKYNKNMSKITFYTDSDDDDDFEYFDFYAMGFGYYAYEYQLFGGKKADKIDVEIVVKSNDGGDELYTNNFQEIIDEYYD